MDVNASKRLNLNIKTHMLCSKLKTLRYILSVFAFHCDSFDIYVKERA